VLIQLFPPDDERLSLETCTGGKINTLKKEKSASSWLKIHNCLRMHGQQNIKFAIRITCTAPNTIFLFKQFWLSHGKN
jgi:hypothetical protein